MLEFSSLFHQYTWGAFPSQVWVISACNSSAFMFHKMCFEYSVTFGRQNEATGKATKWNVVKAIAQILFEDAPREQKSPSLTPVIPTQRLPPNPIQPDINEKLIDCYCNSSSITDYKSKIILGKPRAFSPLGAWTKAGFLGHFKSCACTWHSSAAK